MKTIEERAKDYSYSHGNLYMDSAEEEEIYRGDLVEAFIAGAKSERNELTRWHDPKNELSENSMRVIVCAQLPNGARLITGGWYGADPGEIGWNIDIDWKELEVIGWRPI